MTFDNFTMVATAGILVAASGWLTYQLSLSSALRAR